MADQVYTVPLRGSLKKGETLSHTFTAQINQIKAAQPGPTEVPVWLQLLMALSVLIVLIVIVSLIRHVHH